MEQNCSWLNPRFFLAFSLFQPEKKRKISPYVDTIAFHLLSYIIFLFIFTAIRKIFLVIMFECYGYGSKLQFAESAIFSSFQLIPAREKEKKSLLMSTRLRSTYFPYIIFLFIFTASGEIFLVIMFECCGYGKKLQLAESTIFSSFQLIPAREKEKNFSLCRHDCVPFTFPI